MKNYQDLLDVCSDIFKTVFSNPQLSIKATTSALDIDDWDSLAQITLLMSMEQTFEIRFSLDEVENLQNVGEIIELILVKIRK